MKQFFLILGMMSFAFSNAIASNGEEKAKMILNSDGFMCPEGQHPDEKGWWWGCVDIEKPNPKNPPLPPSQNSPTKKQKEELCKTPETWDAEKCGFINPNTIKDYKKAFDFQKKQQEELSKNMVMNPGNAKVVKEYQKYNKWMLKQSVMSARTWKFNLVQDPNSNPLVNDPVSTYGLLMAKEVKDLDKSKVFKTLKEEGAFLTWFTRSDCHYCHAQRKGVPRIQKRMNDLVVYNVSLDNKCMEGFEGDLCRTYDKEIHEVLGALDVKIVPTLFMFIPNDKEADLGGTWIRLASGVVSDTTIVNRAYSYFKAHASAVRKGLASAIASQPSMDFDYKKPTGAINLKEASNE